MPDTALELRSVMSHLTHHRDPSAAGGHHPGLLCAHTWALEDGRLFRGHTGQCGSETAGKT